MKNFEKVVGSAGHHFNVLCWTRLMADCLLFLFYNGLAYDVSLTMTSFIFGAYSNLIIIKENQTWRDNDNYMFYSLDGTCDVRL